MNKDEKLMTASMTDSTARHKGFSLVELLVAMALGLFLIGAVIGVFVSNQESARTQTDLNNAQEAFRFASHTVRRVVQQGQSIQSPGNGQWLRVLISPNGEDGYKDCLGRPVTVDTVNTFSIVSGALRCHVDTDNTTETLVTGLDPAGSTVLFGEVGDAFWRDNAQWKTGGAVADWADVRSVNVTLAMLDRRGESLGREGRFSATMRMPVLAEAAGIGAGGGIPGGSNGNGGAGDEGDNDNGNNDGDGDEDAASGDAGNDEDEDAANDDDAGGEDGGGADPGDSGGGVAEPPGPFSCSCFFRNPGQGYSLVSSQNNDASCSAQCCAANDTGSGNNRNFVITVASC